MIGGPYIWCSSNILKVSFTSFHMKPMSAADLMYCCLREFASTKKNKRSTENLRLVCGKCLEQPTPYPVRKAVRLLSSQGSTHDTSRSTEHMIGHHRKQSVPTPIAWLSVFITPCGSYYVAFSGVERRDPFVLYFFASTRPNQFRESPPSKALPTQC